MWGYSLVKEPGSFRGQKVSFELKKIIFEVTRSFYGRKYKNKRYFKNGFFSRCFIYIGKTVYVVSIYPLGIFSEEFLFSICQIRLYVTFVMSHKPLHVTPRLATSDWLIGRWLYCKLLPYLKYSNTNEKTDIFSIKKAGKSKKFSGKKNSGDHSRSSVCTLKNKYYFRF